MGSSEAADPVLFAISGDRVDGAAIRSLAQALRHQLILYLRTPLDTVDLVQTIRSLLPHLARCKSRIVIPSRLDVVRTINHPALGLHLRENDLALRDARGLLGRTTLIGRSCHSVAAAGRAASGGADYVTLAPVLLTPNKNIPLGFSTVERAVDVAGHVIPVGGINAGSAARLLDRGCSGVGAIRAVWDRRRGGLISLLRARRRESR